jgi:hypothetical protein
VASFSQVSQPKSCINLHPPPFFLHATTIWFFLNFTVHGDSLRIIRPWFWFVLEKQPVQLCGETPFFLPEVWLGTCISAQTNAGECVTLGPAVHQYALIVSLIITQTDVAIWVTPSFFKQTSIYITKGPLTGIGNKEILVRYAIVILKGKLLNFFLTGAHWSNVT